MKLKSTLLALLLIAMYLALRLPRLRDMPVFCDEATYLRWAQLIRQDPLHYLFISMEDAKLPVHYWLLALAWPLNADPIYAGRLLSVLTGLCTIPALLALCGELRRLTGGRSIGPLAVALMITCPLVTMNQRMALAEPLLLLEAVLLGWLSLRLARRIAEDLPRRRLLADACILGFVWAVTLNTKQDFSYLLWVLPPAALAAYVDRAHWRSRARKFLLPFALATAIGLIFFVPVLFTSDTHHLTARLFYKRGFLLSTVDDSRWTILTRNLTLFFFPSAQGEFNGWPHHPEQPLDTGSLYLYLTPPILFVSVMGVLWMAGRRMWRPLVFLGVWSGAQLGSLMLGANMMFSRYLLLGAFPLLLVAAWAASECFARLRPLTGRAAVPTCTVFLALLLAWPVGASAAMVGDYRAPVLSAHDRMQYISGFPCGGAMQEVVGWLKSQSSSQPITIITREAMGAQSDLPWLALSQDPNVTLLCTDDVPPLLQVAAHDYRCYLSTQQWVKNSKQWINITADRPIYYCVQGVYSEKSKPMEFDPPPEKLGPRTSVVRTFVNPPITPRSPPMSAISVYRIFPTTD